MIATNPGEKPRPLRQVVSGGELSRLMLGIRTMFAGADATETVIFDEVDTGISGRTAQKAAEKEEKSVSEDIARKREENQERPARDSAHVAGAEENDSCPRRSKKM